MKKRIVSLVLAAVLLCAALPLGASAAARRTFDDVYRGQWFAGAVYALVEKGIVNGVTDKAFKPDQELTRGQFAKLLAYATLSEKELEPYGQEQVFDDVVSGKWYAPSINWAAGNEIAKGDKGKFNPEGKVKRCEAAAFLSRYAENIQGVELNRDGEEKLFADDDSIPNWAKEEVYLCRRAGLIAGFPDGTFAPTKSLTRGQAAVLLCRLLNITELPDSQLPEKPLPAYEPPATFSKSVAGVTVTGVELDPSRGYTTRAVLANDRLFSTESASSMASRNNAVVAVNGTFFQSYDGSNVTFGTVMSHGKFLRIDNTRAPYKPTFAVDSQGKATIEYCKINQVLSVYREGELVGTDENVGCNLTTSATDGTRMIVTREFGATLSGAVESAIEVDKEGKITKAYPNGGSDLPIPASGYLAYVRHRRWAADPMLTKYQVGDDVVVSVKYEGATKQSYDTLLSCGPAVVKHGAAYGDRTTYAQEGYTEGKIVSDSGARMALGVKADGRVVIVSCSCTLSQLSQVMLGLGCRDAFNLDGGASTYLYVNGSTLASPGRALNNMLVFSKK